MEPYQLIARLVRDTGLSTMQVARDIDCASFQGTLHKYINGQVPNPTRNTASKIAKHFGLPVDAIYDKAAAERIARERGLLDLVTPLKVAEPTANFMVSIPLQPRKLSAAIEAHIQRLDIEQLKGLEAVVSAYLDAVAPKRLAKTKRAQ